jgi:hypothetical protein
MDRVRPAPLFQGNCSKWAETLWIARSMVSLNIAEASARGRLVVVRREPFAAIPQTVTAPN